MQHTAGRSIGKSEQQSLRDGAKTSFEIAKLESLSRGIVRFPMSAAQVVTREG